MKKTLEDIVVKGQTVLLRVDYNVPLNAVGEIQDDERIRKSLPTLKYLINEGAKLVLFSHLGRIKTPADKAGKSLEVVADHLSDLLGLPVLFSTETRGKALEEAVAQLAKGDVLLVENTRFEDADGQKESKNDQALAAYWASLGDVYVFDAYGTAHRAHASTAGMAAHSKTSALGFLVEDELAAMDPVLSDPTQPFVLILGGAKVSDKLSLIQYFLDKADYILIGGGMAYTFLKAQGHEIGASLCETGMVTVATDLLEKAGGRVILPEDSIVSGNLSAETETEISGADIPAGLIGGDIGPATIANYQKIIAQAKTVVWNGPMGIFENEKFATGTLAIGNSLADAKEARTIVGGGDSVSAITRFGRSGDITHISTGGGATLALLSGESLPAIEAIQDK